MSIEAMRELKTLASVCPELNMANYTEDDVRHLNDWAIEMSLLVEQYALSQQPDNAACKSVQKRLAAQQPATGEPVLDATLTRDLQASTPAPWEASFHKTVTGKPFGIVTGGQPGNGRMDIVICYGPDAYDEPLSFKAFLANAPLIAAAPKLLAALELIANAENSALDLAYCKGVARAAIGASATTSR